MLRTKSRSCLAKHTITTTYTALIAATRQYSSLLSKLQLSYTIETPSRPTITTMSPPEIAQPGSKRRLVDEDTTLAKKVRTSSCQVGDNAFCATRCPSIICSAFTCWTVALCRFLGHSAAGRTAFFRSAYACSAITLCHVVIRACENCR